MPGQRPAARPGFRRAEHRISPVAVQAVIFDWGGTLTPWHSIDHAELWQRTCAPHFAPDRAAPAAAAILAAERELWQLAERDQRSATIYQVFQRAGVAPTEALLADYLEAWEPHTFTDADAAGLFRRLRERGIRIGVLSNTMWPRSWHEQVFRRDGVLELIDGAVYSSEIDWTKPHPEAFLAAMRAVGAAEPAACVFVGDRPYDDVHGAKSLGMRAVLIPNSDVPRCPGAEPDAVLSRLADLPALLDTW
jgi:putative hydrolase of the HAD superfamily